MIKDSVMNANQLLSIALPTVATIRPAFRIAIATLLIAWMVANEFVNKKIENRNEYQDLDLFCISFNL